MSRTRFTLLSVILCSLLATCVPATGQQPLQPLELANGVTVRLTPDLKAVMAVADGEERSLGGRTDAAFLSLSAIVNATGANVGVAVVEHWEDGERIEIYMTSGDDIAPVAAFDAPSPHLGISDWDGDGDLDFSVPRDVSDLFYAERLISGETGGPFVYELAGSGVLRSSVSCFPMRAAYRENELAFLEGELQARQAIDGEMSLGAWKLTQQDMDQLQQFISRMRAVIRGRCRRDAVESQSAR